MILTRVCTTKTQPHKQPPLSLSLSHTVAISKTQKAKNPEISKNRFFHFFFHFPLKVSQKPSHFLEKPNQNYLFFLSFLGVLKTHTHTQKKKKKGNRFIVWNRRKDSGFFCICGVWQGMLFTTKTVSFSWTTFLFLFYFLSHLLW